MAREFNPDLFGATDVDLQTKIQNEVTAGGVESLKRKVREQESEIMKLSQKVDKLTLALEQKNVQHQHGLRSLEAQSKAATQALASKLQSLVAKFTERRVAEAKTQELIDRHNQMVQTFELRMTNMQKVTSDIEMKLMGYQATIDEIVREIRHLKR